MDKFQSIIKKIWQDPVMSKVIAVGILGLIGFLWHINQKQSDINRPGENTVTPKTEVSKPSSIAPSLQEKPIVETKTQKTDQQVLENNEVKPPSTSVDQKQQQQLAQSTVASSDPNITAKSNSINPPDDIKENVVVVETCIKNNTGDYSFTNHTSKSMNARIYLKSDMRNPVGELIISPGLASTLYDLSVGSYSCVIEEAAYRSDHGIPGNLPYGYTPYKMQTEIRVEQCKSKSFSIR